MNRRCDGRDRGGGAFAAPVRLLIAAAALVAVAGAARAETRALVVGIDAYVTKPLKGAVADARDIADALRARGAGDVTVLLDEQATRRSVLAALEGLVARSRAGDLVVVTFAGHGIREKWGKTHPPGVREGDPHESFVLGRFAPPDAAGRVDRGQGGAASERIWGTEINARLVALQARGTRTIFVADTCHGGGLTRRPLVGAAGGGLADRSFPAFDFQEGQDPLAQGAAALPAPVDTDATLPDLTLLAAVDRTQTAPEVMIPKAGGHPRGALSYAFARAIEGRVATAEPTLVTRGELVDFIGGAVAPLTDNRQDPDLRPRHDFDRVVIDFARDFPAAPRPQPSGSVLSEQTAKPVLRIHILGREQFSAFEDAAVRVEPSAAGDPADLIWDAERREAFSANGDLVASDVSVRRLLGVAAREEALRRLTRLAAERPRPLRLVDGNRRYGPGEFAILDVASEAGSRSDRAHFALINVTGTGIVQFLYPQFERGDGAVMVGDRPFEPLRVVAPFGADTLVLISSAKPMTDLVRKLRSMDGRAMAIDAAGAIAASSPGDLRIGLQQVFTIGERR